MSSATHQADAITLSILQAMKARGEKITCLTSYDASFTRLLERQGVEVLLVGDSLGMVIQGHDTTRSVSMDDMVYHCEQVSRVREKSYLIADMSFNSYADSSSAVLNAQRLINEAGADMVKLEGGAAQLENVRALTQQGIPVCGHLGLLPQSVESADGFRVQGRDETTAQKIIDDAMALQAAGAGLLVLECVPANLGKKLSDVVNIPVIGIGAGVDCDGQVLVIYDAIGLTTGKRPRFVRDFLSATCSLDEAITDFVKQVKSGEFPSHEESYE